MLREVDFHEWCPKCEYYELKENEDPCHDCLNEPANDDSRKPSLFKEADKIETEGTVGRKSRKSFVTRRTD